MPILSDYHMHSHHSGDCDASMKSMASAAVRAGLQNICFTEHLDFDFPGYPDLPRDCFLLNDDRYEQELRLLQKQYAETPGQDLSICFGIECGLQLCCQEKNRAFLHRKPYDFVLGSLHLCDGDDPYYDSFYQTHPDEDAALLLYFEETLKNIEAFHDLDVLAHLDYMVRYCSRLHQRTDFRRYEDILTAILGELVRTGRGLEVNTGGLRRGMQETNPGPDAVRRYRELGGRIITIG